jgi:hypothetical protein
VGPNGAWPCENSIWESRAAVSSVAAAAQASADARENHQHAVAEANARASNAAYARSHPAPIVYHGRGTTWTVTPSNRCDIGSQTCGTFAQHFGNQLLNIACGLTVCPLVQGAKDAYKLVTDPSGYWQDETDRWNATKAYWSAQWDTYNKLANAPGVKASPNQYGEAAVLFGMKWAGDRISDFENDPGTASANIVVFFVSFAIPVPKGVGAGADATTLSMRARPSVDTAAFTTGERTAEGGIRNSRQFWKTWSQDYPDTLSAKNMSNINEGRSPVVDDTWTSVYPEDAQYMNDRLVHHHISQGRYATPLPETLHKEATTDLDHRMGGPQAL